MGSTPEGLFVFLLEHNTLPAPLEGNHYPDFYGINFLAFLKNSLTLRYVSTHKKFNLVWLLSLPL